MKTTGRRLLLGLFLAVLLGASVYAFLPGPVAVETAVVAPGPLAASIDEEGRTRARPGARELIAELQEAGVLLAIATGKSQRGLQRALADAGLTTQFAATRCADQTHPKPHPAMLLELADELMVAPWRMLMVGDTTHDLQMAAAADAAAVA